MRVESGRTLGRVLSIDKPAGGGHNFSYNSVPFFIARAYIFPFSNIFKTKWPKSEEKLNCGGSG